MFIKLCGFKESYRSVIRSVNFRWWFTQRGMAWSSVHISRLPVVFHLESYKYCRHRPEKFQVVCSRKLHHFRIQTSWWVTFLHSTLTVASKLAQAVIMTKRFLALGALQIEQAQLIIRLNDGVSRPSGKLIWSHSFRRRHFNHLRECSGGPLQFKGCEEGNTAHWPQTTVARASWRNAEGHCN